jgi:hypothetical protein
MRRPQGHSDAGRIGSIEEYSDFIGNWTRDPSVPQTSAVSRAPDRGNKAKVRRDRNKWISLVNMVMILQIPQTKETSPSIK